MYSIERIVSLIFNIYSWMLIAYVLMSWVPQMRETPIGDILRKLVEPYLKLFRRFIPPIGGMLDISPIVALFALNFIQIGVITVLGYLGI